MFTCKNVAPRKGYENVFAILNTSGTKGVVSKHTYHNSSPTQPGRSAALLLFQGNLIVNLIAALMVVIILPYVFIV